MEGVAIHENEQEIVAIHCGSKPKGLLLPTNGANYCCQNLVQQYKVPVKLHITHLK